MAHQVQDLELHAGNDVVIPVTVTVDGLPESDPADLSDVTNIVWAVALAAVDSPFVRLITKTLGDGIELTDAVNGEFEITLDAADTDTLNGHYLHEARITEADGKKSTVLSGKMTIWRTILEDDE